LGRGRSTMRTRLRTHGGCPCRRYKIFRIEKCAPRAQTARARCGAAATGWRRRCGRRSCRPRSPPSCCAPARASTSSGAARAACGARQRMRPAYAAAARMREAALRRLARRWPPGARSPPRARGRSPSIAPRARYALLVLATDVAFSAVAAPDRRRQICCRVLPAAACPARCASASTAASAWHGGGVRPIAVPSLQGLLRRCGAGAGPGAHRHGRRRSAAQLRAGAHHAAPPRLPQDLLVARARRMQ